MSWIVDCLIQGDRRYYKARYCDLHLYKLVSSVLSGPDPQTSHPPHSRPPSWLRLCPESGRARPRGWGPGPPLRPPSSCCRCPREISGWLSPGGCGSCNSHLQARTCWSPPPPPPPPCFSPPGLWTWGCEGTARPDSSPRPPAWRRPRRGWGWRGSGSGSPGRWKELRGEQEDHQIILGMLIDAIIETSRRDCLCRARLKTRNITRFLWSLARVIEIRCGPSPGSEEIVTSIKQTLYLTSSTGCSPWGSSSCGTRPRPLSTRRPSRSPPSWNTCGARDCGELRSENKEFWFGWFWSFQMHRWCECGPGSRNKQNFLYCCKSEVNEIWKVQASERNSRFLGIFPGIAEYCIKCHYPYQQAVSEWVSLLFVDSLFDCGRKWEKVSLTRVNDKSRNLHANKMLGLIAIWTRF